MNRLTMVFTVLATLCVTAASGGPSFEPERHVRKELRGPNAPDASVFRIILLKFHSETERRSERELEDWIFSEMNMTWLPDAKVWTWINDEPPRHSRKEIREFVRFLHELSTLAIETEINTKRSVLCPDEGFSTLEQKFQALERRDELKRVDAEFFLDYAFEQMGEELSASLRAWISRAKMGYSSTQYNYRTLWKGRESSLDADIAAFCNETAGADK